MDKRIWIAALAVLVMGSAIGCGEKEAETTEPPATTTESTGANNMNEVGGPIAKPDAKNASIVDYTNDKGEVICPVMKTVLPDKAKAVSYQDYEGMRYYFCCGGCPEDFAKDPTKYAMVNHGDHSHAPGEAAH